MIAPVPLLLVCGDSGCKSFLALVPAYFSAAATVAPFGLPSPVQASHPADASKLPLLPDVISWPIVPALYNLGLITPAGCVADALMRAISAAHNGATALVPPTTVCWPPINTS